MCSCNLRYANRQQLINDGFVNVFPTSSFISTPTYSDFMFYRCINKDKFSNALNSIKDGNSTLGTKVVTNEDVNKLAQIADSGRDMQIWGVSIKRLLGSIKYDQSELDNAQCKIAFSKD